MAESTCSQDDREGDEREGDQGQAAESHETGTCLDESLLLLLGGCVGVAHDDFLLFWCLGVGQTRNFGGGSKIVLIRPAAGFRLGLNIPKRSGRGSTLLRLPMSRLLVIDPVYLGDEHSQLRVVTELVLPLLADLGLDPLDLLPSRLVLDVTALEAPARPGADGDRTLADATPLLLTHGRHDSHLVSNFLQHDSH